MALLPPGLDVKATNLPCTGKAAVRGRALGAVLRAAAAEVETTTVVWYAEDRKAPGISSMPFSWGTNTASVRSTMATSCCRKV